MVLDLSMAIFYGVHKSIQVTQTIDYRASYVYGI